MEDLLVEKMLVGVSAGVVEVVEWLSLQDDMLNKMREQMDAAAEAMNPEQMMKTIFPAGLPGCRLPIPSV